MLEINTGINIAISTIYASILKNTIFNAISSQIRFNEEELFISISRLHNDNSVHIVYVRY